MILRARHHLQGLAARYSQELALDRGAVARQLQEIQLQQMQQLQQLRPHPGSPTASAASSLNGASNIYATIGSANGASSSVNAPLIAPTHTYANISRGGRAFQPGSYNVRICIELVFKVFGKKVFFRFFRVRVALATERRRTCTISPPNTKAEIARRRGKEQTNYLQAGIWKTQNEKVFIRRYAR